MKNNNEKTTVRDMAKKGLKISLCAVLTGSLAAGAFQGVNMLTGWNQQEVSAAGQLSLMSAENSDADSTVVKGGLDVSDIAEEAMPSVVAITTKSVQEVQDYFGFFYGRGSGYAPQQEVQGSGSGIIIGKNDKELLIVTNYHVIEDANTVSVAFTDGNAYEASVKGYDAYRDLAIVSVALSELSEDTVNSISVATMGSSDDLKVGEQVVAIGNALGYGQSVTTGIVSAKNRRMDGSSVKQDSDEKSGVNLIQTDAAINPGNSGGALLNMKGEVVGINSAKLASTEVEGMGYAIAISDVSDILERLMNEEPREKSEDGKHGVLSITGATVSDEASQVYGIPEGVFVKEVTEGGAADKAGIKQNSVIIEFDGRRVATIEELVDLLEYYKPGEEVEVLIEIQSGNGYEEKTVTVTLDESKDEEKPKDTDAQNEDSQSGDSQSGGSQDENSQEGAEITGMPQQPNDEYGNWQWGDEAEEGLRDFFEQWW